MAGQENEYENYTAQTGGRLFSNAMFGFNKEEVLEYLEEVADENFQQQEASEMRIQELNSRIQQLEAAGGAKQGSVAPEELAQLKAQHEQQLADLRAQLGEVKQQLDITRAATQQAEEELQQAREDLQTAQKQNEWLREEYQTSDGQVADLRRQIELLREERGDESAELTELRKQLQAAEADRDGLRRQLQNSQSSVNEDMKAQLAQAADEIMQLRAQLAEAAEDESQADEKAQAQIQAQAAEIEELRSQMEQLQDDLEQAQQAQPEPDEDTLAELEQAQNELAELRAQLDEYEAYDAEWTEEDERRETAYRSASAIIAEATEEAQRIRQDAENEKRRIKRQLHTSAGGLTESITNLKEEVSGVEGDVSGILEAVQSALADVLTALGRTEQNLATFDTQVERYPGTAPSVPKRQVVYFQPTQEITTGQAVGMPGTSLGNAGFKRVEVTPEPPSGNLKAFKPSYTSANGEELSQDEKLRNLSETLVDTLRQMLN